MAPKVQLGYGYGWMISPELNRRCLHHDGGGAGNSAEILRFPDEKACVVVLSNLQTAPVKRVSRDLAAILFGEQCEHPCLVDPKVLESYADQYEDKSVPGLRFSVRRDGSYLTITFSGQMAEPLPLVPVSDREFLLAMGETRIAFGKEPAGRVTPCVLAEGGTRRRAERREPVNLDPYVGRYRPEQGLVTGVKKEGDKLLMSMNGESGPWIELVPDEGDAVTVPDVVGARVEFTRDEQRRVTGRVFQRGEFQLRFQKLK
jgi:hypothetical protein